MATNIELATPRDFGEIINDTFTFIRQNFKPLLKYFFIFCGFFVLVTASVTIVLQIKAINIVGSYNPDNFNEGNAFTRVFSLLWGYLLLGLFMVFEYVAVNVTVLCFITLYKQKQNTIPTSEEMWGYIKYFYLRILWCTILLYLLIIVGMVFCIIPGIYLSVVFVLVPPIMIMENTSFGYAFNKSFRLIKDNWWVTFGVIIVISIILYVLNLAVSIPSMVLGAGNVFLHITKRSATLSLPVAILTAAVDSIASFFRILMIVAVSLCYFNLAETKEGTALMERINQFGSTDTTPDAAPEEY
ncbi:MAG: hypothetical protein ACHQHN_02145 [Sphingobacteriales bacterium]